MIKVMQFIYGFNMGGAETLVKDYVLGLDKTKFDVMVLCYDKLNSPYDELLKNEGVKVKYICDDIPTWGKRNIWLKLLNRIMLYVKIRKYIREIQPDIIHEHIVLNSYLKFARPKKPVAIFYTQHFQVNQWIANYPKDIRAAKWLIKHYPMQIIALQESMKRELDELLNINNTVVLNNGVNIEYFRKGKEKNIVRKELGIPQGAFLIGHVGRFSRIKNHTFLVDIFVEIIRKEPNAYLLMIGQGETEEDIVKKIYLLGLEKHIMIFSNRTDIPDLMNAMDMLVFPSISEGLGIVIVEAQISGLRCMVSDVIPREVGFSNLLRYCSLDDEPIKWAEEILNWQYQKPEYFGKDKWDMSKIILNLQKLYEHYVIGTE